MGHDGYFAEPGIFERVGRVATPLGHLAYGASGQGPTVVFLHGNSSAKEIFARQMVPELTERYQLLAFDMMGHGDSDDARTPEEGYGMHAFGTAVMAALDALEIEKAAIVGWSMGGHIALEILARWPGAVAAWITGTPPIDGSAADIGAAFLPSDHMALTFQAELSEEEIVIFAGNTFGTEVPIEPWMVRAARRADGRFRPMMLVSAQKGWDLNERRIVAECDKPLAVVTGEREPFVSNAFLKGLSYRNLWGGRVHVLPRLGHMPFWESPETVNPLLGHFLDDVLSA